ncbi:glycoside hydrolase family 16 protein [Nocardioides halotolerans]|uniref:glycoside hydrolase family 16 protein n=1 Tax=Nocardioides halotolerans TaxID=433660 RepID=UPI00048EEB05|nr:glycoside hydrolase family 16 protein [Nocardioides halotolerans]
MRVRDAVPVILVLALSPCAPVPADAAAHRPLVLAQPAVKGEHAQLTGRVAMKATKVVIQRKAGKRWKKVRAVKVRHHSFKTKLPLLDQPQKIRAVVGKARSKPRTLPALAPSDACGPQPLKADGTRWSCTFNDDFAGSALDRTKWVPQTIFSSGNFLVGPYACYYDDPSLISVSGGALHLTVRGLAPPRQCMEVVPLLPTSYGAGMVSTYHLFSQQYGRFEARFRTTRTDKPGLQESWWLWPDDREGILASWPLAGEIDIVETYSKYPGLGIPFLHYTGNDNGGPVPGLNTSWDCEARRGVFNTYTLVWTATSLEAFVNGESCLLNTSGNTAFMKKYILNLTQALGTGDNSYTGTAPLPATMDVDYVKVWQ